MQLNKKSPAAKDQRIPMDEQNEFSNIVNNNGNNSSEIKVNLQSPFQDKNEVNYAKEKMFTPGQQNCTTKRSKWIESVWFCPTMLLT